MTGTSLAPWLTAALTILYAALGWATGRALAGGGYRIEEDEAQGRPGSTWWPPLLAGGLAYLACVHVGWRAQGAALALVLLVVWLGVVVIWIDLDVHRIPVGLIWPAIPWVLALLAVATLGDGRGWAPVVGALVGFVALGGFYALWSLLPGGGIGWGDVRLAALLGPVLGWFGVGRLVVATLVTFLLGGVFAVAAMARHGFSLKVQTAYGPAIVLGALAALLFASQIMSALLTL